MRRSNAESKSCGKLYELWHDRRSFPVRLRIALLCAAAFCINLIFYAPSGGTINMFFVGPADSTLIFCKDIAARFGWYVSTLLYVPAVCFGAYIVYLLGALVTKPRRSC